MMTDEPRIQERKAFLAQVEDLLGNGEDEAVWALAEARLARSPDDLDACLALCRVRIRQGRLDEAREMLRKWDERLAGLGRIYTLLGDGFLQQGQEEEARAVYRKVMFLNPGPPGPPEEEPPTAEGERETDVPTDFQTVTLAELYIRQGHPEQAAAVLEAILQKDPRHEKALEKLREIRGAMGGEGAAAEKDPIVAELSRWLERIGRRTP